MARATTPSEIEAFHLQSFGYALATLHRLNRERLAETLTGTGLHMGHVLLLATLRAQRALEGESTLTQTKLGQLAGIEKSSLVLFLDVLEREGWVERRRHPDDRRVHIVHLTGAGARRFEKVGRKLHARQEENLEPLSVGERGQLLELMTRLISHLGSG
jgi:DNA-binding MarR family transcriptional regulator